jgi:hypothetical protein
VRHANEARITANVHQPDHARRSFARKNARLRQGAMPLPIRFLSAQDADELRRAWVERHLIDAGAGVSTT